MNSENYKGDLPGLLHLIHLESELLMAVAYLRVFGSLPEGVGMTLVTYWAGYEYTLYGLAPGDWHSEAYADVASSVRTIAAYINQKEWEGGCQQARYELSLMEQSVS